MDDFYNPTYGTCILVHSWCSQYNLTNIHILPHMDSINMVYDLEPFLLGTIRLKFLMEKVPNGIPEKYEKKVCSQPEIIFLAFTAFDCISKKWYFRKNLLGHFSKMDIFKMSNF